MPQELREVSLESFDSANGASLGFVINVEKLKDLKRKTLTSDQIDDLMDAAERQMSEFRPRSYNEKSTNSEDEPPEPLPGGEAIGTHLGVAGLLGRVVRNSDFVSIEEKLVASRDYIAAYAKGYVYIYNFAEKIARSISRSLESKWKERGAKVTSIPPELIAYMIRILFFFVIQSAICNQFASENLSEVYERFIEDDTLTNIERMFVVMVIVEIGGANWDRPVESLVKRNKKNRIALDVIVDKIWTLLHTRVTTQAERENIASLAYTIERHMGVEKWAKSAITQKVIEVAKETTRREEI